MRMAEGARRLSLALRETGRAGAGEQITKAGLPQTCATLGGIGVGSGQARAERWLGGGSET
ncbi:hypothetical protein BKA80DRAFT_280657 [Phyllosticta citrichinensis]